MSVGCGEEKIAIFYHYLYFENTVMLQQRIKKSVVGEGGRDSIEIIALPLYLAATILISSIAPHMIIMKHH